MGWDAVVVAAGGTGAPPPPHSIRRSIRVTDPPFTAAGPPPCDNDVPVGGRVCLACKKGSVGRCSEVRDGAGRCGAVSGGVGRCGGRGAVRGAPCGAVQGGALNAARRWLGGPVWPQAGHALAAFLTPGASADV
eukprot:Tamp_27127.p2 GENE.Tamp_27127~~Tamp_27127.p2  ORF type:complete len:134 (+),score=2.51 Tamp_27127:391-792(+)